MDFETQFLPQLGDQSAVIVLPAPENHPPALAVMIELNNGQTLPTALRTLVGSLAMMNQLDAEKKGIEPVIALQNQTYKDVGLMTLNLRDPKLKGKLNPTLFTRGRFLVISTTPESAKALIEALLIARHATVDRRFHVDFEQHVHTAPQV